MTFPTNSNNSASGGYLLPTAPAPAPGGLTFAQFVQQVFVGLSGLDPTLVRDRWQINPPKQPDITVDWLSIGLTEDNADQNAYVNIKPDGSTVMQRMSELNMQCSFYGPNALLYGKLVRDGFQIGQNLEALQSGGMNFKSATSLVRAPDIVNERWCNRWIMTVYLRQQTLRVYPILSLLSASGTLNENVSSGLKSVPISVTR